MKNQKNRPEWVKTLGLFAVVIGEIVSCTGAGVFVGWLLQSKLGWPWWVIVLTSLAGLALAMVRVARAAALLK